MLHLSNALLRGYLEHLGAIAPPAMLHLVGIRSATPVGDDGCSISVHPPAFNKWDDSIGYFGTELKVYAATVDPGATWTARPSNPKGAAHLLGLEDGGKPYLYQFGLHKGKPALVQAGPVTVRRDRDRDGTAEPGEPISSGWFGINIHRGGMRPDVGAWSAGCQVIPAIDYADFYEVARASGEKLLRYFLIDGPALGLWVDGGQPA